MKGRRTHYKLEQLKRGDKQLMMLQLMLIIKILKISLKDKNLLKARNNNIKKEMLIQLQK